MHSSVPVGVGQVFLRTVILIHQDAAESFPRFHREQKTLQKETVNWTSLEFVPPQCW